MSNIQLDPSFNKEALGTPVQLDPKINKQNLDSDLKKREMILKHGLLGKLFGSNDNVPHYIIGFVSIVIIIATSIYTFFPRPELSPKDLWVVVTPILTSILGYIFGAASNKGN